MGSREKRKYDASRIITTVSREVAHCSPSHARRHGRCVGSHEPASSSRKRKGGIGAPEPDANGLGVDERYWMSKVDAVNFQV